MKLTVCILLCLLAICVNYLHAEQVFNANIGSTPVNGNENLHNKKLNFFIISKPKKLIDPATRYNMLRGKLRAFLKPQEFICIVASSTEEMKNKVLKALEKNNATIGSIWFDSHGNYRKGYSLFTIGKDEINYHNINDTQKNKSFQQLANFCTSETKIGIGSCYAGATYCKPSAEAATTNRMNGDSLMMGIGNIFACATIFACESWVMTKPGLFHKRYALEGHPQLKRFKDVVFEPVWENLWKWNEYNAATKCFTSVDPVTLDKYGNLMTRTLSETDKEVIQKVINKNIEKLEPGLYK